MEKKWIFKAIGSLEAVTGIVGAGVVVWMLMNGEAQNLLPLTIYILITALFIVAGIQLFRCKNAGIWLSIAAQFIAIPSYESLNFALEYNNILRLRIYMSTEEHILSFDVVASIIFMYLVLSLPQSPNKQLSSDSGADAPPPAS